MRGWWIPCILAGVLAGCTPSQYARQADKAAYGTIRGAQQAALGGSGDFDVSYRPYAREATTQPGEIRLGDKRIPLGDKPPVVLSFNDCLQIALRNSRSFQTRRETLYSSALTLASESRTWKWSLLEGSLTGAAEHQFTRNTGETNTGSAGAAASLTQRFVDGGILTLGASLDLASDLVGWKGTTVGSLLDANFTQPLLRGAWHGFAYETQFRRERDFLFSIFDYDRFTQTFATDVFRRYYEVLRQRDQLENERENIKRLEQTLALTRVLVKGGERSPIEEDQAEQNLLDARVRLEQDTQGYQDAVDGFKLALGLPVEAQVVLDYPGALKSLGDAGPRPLPFEEEEAMRVAMSVRPDVLTERAKVRDARRDLEIAANNFLPQLDVTLGASAPGTDPHKFARVRFHDHTRTAGAEFQYDLDQTANRDAYRRAMIALEKAIRDYAEFADQVRLDVRQSYRALVRNQRSYEIQQQNVVIAKRRRKLASLQQMAGEASARDVLEAEEALRSAQNGLTSALVSYTTTRLEFLAQLGMIDVDPAGRIVERAAPRTFERIEKRYPQTQAAQTAGEPRR